MFARQQARRRLSPSRIRAGAAEFHDHFPNSVGVLVREVRLHPDDRILTIDCGTLQIHFVLFGGASGNVLLTDANGMILDSFKVRTVKNLALEKSVMPRTVENQRLQPNKPYSPLTEADVFLGKIYAQEIAVEQRFCPGECSAR